MNPAFRLFALTAIATVTAGATACGTTGRVRLPPAQASNVQPKPKSKPDPQADPVAPPIAPQWYDAQSEVAADEPSDSQDADRPRVVPKPDPNRPMLNQGSPLGTNLAPVTVTTRDRVFVDLFKLATPWVSVGERKWDDGRKIAVNERGWVSSLVVGQSAASQMYAFEGGRMVATYQGLGIVRIEGKVTIHSQDRGRIEFTAAPRSTITFIISAINPRDPLRNVRVIPAALQSVSSPPVFHPDFLKAAGRFSTLRFAGWTRASTNPVKKWNDRTTVEDSRQTGRTGVAYEYMIQLANELRANLWLTVPLRADDDHVTRLAQLIRTNLEPELQVYVEYGHRMMIPGTRGYKYAVDRGRRLGASDDETAAAQFYARRSKVVFQLFEKAFSSRDRMVRVIAGDARAPDDLQALLSFEGLAGDCDALAIEALLGQRLRTAEWQTQIRRNDVQWLLDQLEQQSLPALLGHVRNAYQLAERYRLRLLGSTFGLDLRLSKRSRDKTVDRRFTQANRNPRIATLYGALLDGWRTNGGELANHAALATKYSSRGRLGALESVTRLQAPKYQALMSFIDRSPKWWTTRAVPPPVVGSAPPPPPPPPVIETPPDVSITQRPAVEKKPARDRTIIWALGSVGVASLAATAAFLSLHVDAASERDLRLAEDPAPASGREARDLDDEAFMWSSLATGGIVLTAGALTAAGVLSLTEPERRAGQEVSTNPWPWITGLTGLVAAGAGTLYLVNALDAANERDRRVDQMDQMQMAGGAANSAPARTLDDQVNTWSLLSLAGYATAAVSLAISIYLFVADGQTIDYEMNLQEYLENGSVILSPTGIYVRW